MIMMAWVTVKRAFFDLQSLEVQMDPLKYRTHRETPPHLASLNHYVEAILVGYPAIHAWDERLTLNQAMMADLVIELFSCKHIVEVQMAA